VPGHDRQVGRFHQVRENLQVKEIIVGDGESGKRFVLVYNPKEAERDRIRREQHISKTPSKLSARGIIFLVQ
jgi:hypothetical protein